MLSLRLILSREGEKNLSPGRFCLATTIASSFSVVKIWTITGEEKRRNLGSERDL